MAGARGLAAPRVRVRDALLVALLFGGFQALMPAVGWAIGVALLDHVRAWGHWVTFGVLFAIGVKMILDARQEPSDGSGPSNDAGFGLKILVVLAFATSIDALVAGLTLGIEGMSVVRACGVIGIVTGILSLAGVYAGRHLGGHFGARLDVAGGLVLVGLGIKALVEHYWRSR